MKKSIRESAKAGFIGGALSAVISGLLGYYLIPVPLTIIDNSISHTVGGFFCGFISAFLGIMALAIRHGRRSGGPGTANG